MKRRERVFRIIDNPACDDRFPFALLDPDDTIVNIGAAPDHLAQHAYETLYADKVLHDEVEVASDFRF